MTPKPAARRLVFVAAMGLVLGACQAPSAATPSPSAIVPAAIVSSAPNPEPSRSTAPALTPTPAPTPTASPKPLTWTDPITIKGLDDCIIVVAAIDDGGGDHLAANCGTDRSEIRYAVSANGTSWTTTVFKPPTGRLELDPQLAIAGNTLYLAYTRDAPTEGGCGDDGLADLGVYYRTRQLPDGEWSDSVRIGVVADHLQSLRVSGSTVHATVTNEKDGSTYYETASGSATTRVAVSDAAGWSSLRIGDDGKARIAYEASKGLRFATAAGAKIATTAIPDTDRGWDPFLVLAPGNDAYVLWKRSYHGAGCAGGGPDPDDGTYLSTNAGGSWATSRVTPLIGAAALTLDPLTGELHALIGDYQTMDDFHRDAGGTWTHGPFSTDNVSSPTIKQDPRNGALFAAYVADPVEGEGGHLQVEFRFRR